MSLIVTTFYTGQTCLLAPLNNMEHDNLIEQKNKYLDDVAQFLVKHVPDYTELSAESLHELEHIWLAIGDNRMEFIAILSNLRKTRKKRVAPEV